MNWSPLVILLILVVVVALLWTQTKMMNPVKRMVGVKVTPMPSRKDVESIVLRKFELISQGQPEMQALENAEQEHEQKLLQLGYEMSEADEEAAEARRQAEQFARDEEERLRQQAAEEARRQAEHERMGFNEPAPKSETSDVDCQTKMCEHGIYKRGDWVQWVKDHPGDLDSGIVTECKNAGNFCRQ